MKVDFIGFSFDVPAPVTFDETIARLEMRSGRPKRYGPHQKKIYIDSRSNPDFYLGLVLTIKDQKKFVELSADNKLNVRDVTNLSKLLDFNYFVIHKRRLNGLYQRYFQSAALSSMCTDVVRMHAVIRKVKRRIDEKALPSGSAKVRYKEVARRYKDRISWQLLVTSMEKMLELMGQLRRIQSFSVEYAALTSPEPVFIPVNNSVVKERRRFTINRGVAPAQILDGVANALQSIGVRNGSVEGYNIDGDKVTLRIYNNAEIFADFNYDDVVTYMHDKDIENLGDSWVIQQLLETCASMPALYK
ncbi:MAG: hypothetical protein Q8K97_07600 [Pseudohongiella sp.]|nr:hypothetical protein [Pseudohongiella sp.]